MRQTNKENRFSSNKPNGRERRTTVRSILSTHDFSRSCLCNFLFLLLSVYMHVEYRRKAAPTNVDQKGDLLYISFLLIVDISAAIDAEKYRANTFIYIYIYIYLSTEDKSSSPIRKKNMEQQHSTTKSHLYTPPQISFSHTS
jgi:hypothetical protein